MSLATRCPHCGTAFKLVRDQLLLHRGWVRCGRCGEAFNAADHRFEIQLPEQAQKSEISAPENTTEPAPQTTEHTVDAPELAPPPLALLDDAPTHTTPESVEPANLQPTQTPVAPPAAAIPTTAATPPTELAAKPTVTPTLPKSPWQVSAFAYAPPKPMAGATQPTEPSPAADVEGSNAGNHETAFAIPQPTADNTDGNEELNWVQDEPPTLQPDTETFDLDASPDAVLLEEFPDMRPTQSAPWTQPDSLDIDLASFSSEAEAALRGENPQPTVNLSTSSLEELVGAAIEEALLVQAPPPQIPTETVEDEISEAGEVAEPALPARLTPHSTAFTARRDLTVLPTIATDKAASEEDSEFDLGAVLHYQFEPEPQESVARRAKTSALIARNEKDFRPAPAQSGSEETAEATTLPEPLFVRQARSQERWQQPVVRVLLGMAALLLIAVAGLQAAWTWHDAIAAHWPQTRPVLAQLCQLTGCTLDAPRRPQDLIIDTSAMSPAADGHLQLTATLRNRSTEAVAYPALELTLNSQQDQILVRRVIEPAQYLALSTPLSSAGALKQRVRQGLAPSAELNIRLDLNLNSGQASGYTLYAFYP